MPSKNRPTLDAELVRVRMEAARKDKRLSVKQAAGKAGISEWSWYKKRNPDPEENVAFQWDECVRFAEAIGAPTFWPFYDWAHADDLDRRLGYGGQE